MSSSNSPSPKRMKQTEAEAEVYVDGGESGDGLDSSRHEEILAIVQDDGSDIIVNKDLKDAEEMKGQNPPEGQGDGDGAELVSIATLLLEEEINKEGGGDMTKKEVGSSFLCDVNAAEAAEAVQVPGMEEQNSSTLSFYCPISPVLSPDNGVGINSRPATSLAPDELSQLVGDEKTANDDQD